MKKNNLICNNYISNYEIKIDDEVTYCVKDIIYLEQNISGSSDHKKRHRKKNRDDM